MSQQTLHNSLIKALGIESFTQEKQLEMVEMYGAVIYQAVLTRALEEMEDSLLDEFEKLTDGEPAPDKLILFFTKNIPNFDVMMAEEAQAIIADGKKMMDGMNK